MTLAKKIHEKPLDGFDDFLNALATGKNSKSELSVEMFRGTDINLASHVPYGIGTRIPPLDLALGRDGWPAGRVVEIFGFEGAGKSCVALAAIAAVQRMGGLGLWIDNESAWTPDWARKNSVNPEEVGVVETTCIEGTFEAQQRILDTYARLSEKKPVVVVTDSVTGVPSKETFEKEFGEVNRLGTDARALRDGFRAITQEIAKSKMLFIYINHMIASASQYTANESAGGHALKFYASVRVKLAREKTLVEDNKYVGIQVGIDVVKNKVGRTNNKKSSAILSEHGFDIYEGLFDGFLSIGVIERINNVTYLWKPTETQLKRAEWRTFVDVETEGVDALYTWFLAKARESGQITLHGLK